MGGGSFLKNKSILTNNRDMNEVVLILGRDQVVVTENGGL
jgi:hypothetical protein